MTCSARCSPPSKATGSPASSCWSPRCAGPSTWTASPTWRTRSSTSPIAKALVLLVEMDERVFCVTRSRNAGARRGGSWPESLGGGGHAQAASAIFRGASTRHARHSSPGSTRRGPRAAHGRGRHVEPARRSVDPDDTVAGAMVACQRYGQSGILVVETGAWSAPSAARISTRRSAHGLAHAPVKGIMSSQVATLRARKRRSRELQRLLVGFRRRTRRRARRTSQVVGVVTRSDLLRAARRAGRRSTPSLLRSSRRARSARAPDDGLRCRRRDQRGL